jgi:hypothetical protein
MALGISPLLARLEPLAWGSIGPTTLPFTAYCLRIREQQRCVAAADPGDASRGHDADLCVGLFCAPSGRTREGPNPIDRLPLCGRPCGREGETGVMKGIRQGYFCSCSVANRSFKSRV